MRQYVWLDFHGGCWHLIACNARGPDRKWANRDAALLDLAAEWWVIDESHGKLPIIKHVASRHSCGYGLRRKVH